MKEKEIIQKLEQELYQQKTGHTTFLEVREVRPGGKQDGLDYGFCPAGIDVVVLDRDGTTIAYREISDTQGNTWRIWSAWRKGPVGE